MTNKKIAKIAKEYDLIPDNLIKMVRDTEKKFNVQIEEEVLRNEIEDTKYEMQLNDTVNYILERQQDASGDISAQVGAGETSTSFSGDGAAIIIGAADLIGDIAASCNVPMDFLCDVLMNVEEAREANMSTDREVPAPMPGVIVQDHAKGTTPVKKHPEVGKNVDLSLFED